MDWTVKVTDLAIVFATIFGPIFAVLAQGLIDAKRERRQSRLRVFHTLMRTRARPISEEHVNALNVVPLEFSETAQEHIRTAWRVYMNHFNKNAEAQGWGEKRIELLIRLLQVMGDYLNYKFDAVELENDIYTPIAHGKLEAEQTTIRQGVAALFRGERAIPMEVVKFPGDPAHVEQFQRVLQKVESTLDGLVANRRGVHGQGH